MKSFEQKKKEILSIADPKQACIKAATDRELKVDEIYQIILEYQEKHGVGMEEMCYYPNGERVLTLEMFWEKTDET